MAGAGLMVMALKIGPEPSAELVRGDGLSDSADVVALTLDGEERGAPDGAGRPCGRAI